MRFETIPYMEWVKTKVDFTDPSKVDLAGSGMHPLIRTFDEIGIDPREMPVAGNNFYGYPPLKEAIAVRYGVQPENVLPAQGTSMANFLLLATLLSVGDVLLVESPVYECLTQPARALGARIVPFQRRERNGWKLPVEEILAQVYASGACGILLANPNNPTGAFTPDEELIHLAEQIGEERFIISDEVYREWMPDEERRSVALKRPNIYVTSSLTKVWGFGTLRAGWAIAPERIVRTANRAYDHMGVNTSIPGDWLFERIVRDPKILASLLEKSMAEIEGGREEVDHFLKHGHGKKIATVMPAGGGFGFWRIPGMDGEEVFSRLYEEAGVIVTPGRFFGVPEGFRLAWTQGADKVREGLRRMEAWLEKR